MDELIEYISLMRIYIFIDLKKGLKFSPANEVIWESYGSLRKPLWNKCNYFAPLASIARKFATWSSVQKQNII